MTGDLPETCDRCGYDSRWTIDGGLCSDCRAGDCDTCGRRHTGPRCQTPPTRQETTPCPR